MLFDCSFSSDVANKTKNKIKILTFITENITQHSSIIIIIIIKKHQSLLGYWHQRADERHGNPPPRLPGAISGQRES